MQPNYHGLHPLKRFKLQHHRQEEPQTPEPSPCLPAKKRKESRDSSPPFILPSSTTCNLPAKKRVWALQPLFNSPPEKEEAEFSFDLNLEYQQSPEKQPPTPKLFVPKQDTEIEVETEPEGDDGIVCGVCNSTDGDEIDPIVICDGCDLMVHANCYGDPLTKGIPEGDWFCSTCQHHKHETCCLCPVQGGVMKQTIDGKWAHILCALLVPEVFFKDPEGREGIDCSKVPGRRFESVCYVCKSRNGSAIECSEPKCLLAFHVTCGLNAELCIEYKHGKGGDIVAGFCKSHTEIWNKQQQTGKFKIVAREEHKK